MGPISVEEAGARKVVHVDGWQFVCTEELLLVGQKVPVGITLGFIDEQCNPRASGLIGKGILHLEGVLAGDRLDTKAIGVGFGALDLQGSPGGKDREIRTAHAGQGDGAAC